MADAMTDLDRLIASVAAGDDAYIYRYEYDGVAIDHKHAGNVRAAYFGGLDAAKALHDALLPGWWWVKPDARAWLLAILRAYREGGGA